jgi:hypothetical protein
MAKPYYITNPSAIRTNVITVSIAYSTVFQRALFSGAKGAYPGIVQFSDIVLASLEPDHDFPFA